MTKKRQLQRNEQTRQLILDTAKDIISSKGFENLSIRKIVKKIDYSPAIIYHYFKDKNEIVETLLHMGYMKIVKSLQEITVDRDDPYGVLHATIERYIRSALETPKEYKAFMVRDDEATLKITGLLQRGVSKEKQSVKMMCRTIQTGMEKGIFKECDVELTAQLIWTSSFGLVMKLILEKDIPDEQIDRLIEQHLNMLFYGIMIKEEEKSEKGD